MPAISIFSDRYDWKRLFRPLSEINSGWLVGSLAAFWWNGTIFLCGSTGTAFLTYGNSRGWRSCHACAFVVCFPAVELDFLRNVVSVRVLFFYLFFTLFEMCRTVYGWRTFVRNFNFVFSLTVCWQMVRGPRSTAFYQFDECDLCDVVRWMRIDVWLWITFLCYDWIFDIKSSFRYMGKFISKNKNE